MMKKKSQQFIDSYIMRQVQLHRAFDGVAAKRAADMTKLRDQIVKKIQKDFGALSASELKRVTKEVSDTIINYYVEIKPSIQEVANQIAIKEVAWNATAIVGLAAAHTAPIVLKDVDPLRAAKNALNKTFQGHTFDHWIDSNSQRSAKIVGQVMAQGFISGETTDRIAMSVGDVLGRSTRDVMTITRSYLSSAAQEARLSLLDANSDQFEGYQWVSTLDGRTTIMCAARDGMLYDVNFQPIGHNLPWDDGPGKLHFNCRSTFVPVLPGLDLSVERPAVGAGDDYESGDMVTNTGRVRKPTKANRDNGIFSIEQVPASTNYSQWLKTQPKAFVTDVLGSEKKAQDFLSGRLTLQNFAMMSTPIDVSQL